MKKRTYSSLSRQRVSPQARQASPPAQYGPANELPQPDIASQLAHAARLGHHFGSTGEGGSAPIIQAKLMVNAPGDAYEQEADAVAGQVMRMADGAMQRKAAPGAASEEEEDQLPAGHVLRKAEAGGAFTAGTDVEQRIAGSQGGGAPLTEATRAFMEPRFGADFGGVRVHSDSAAHQLSQDLGARAFTTGQDIFFKQGEYSPGSVGGQQLLAHELTHVVQQQETLQADPPAANQSAPDLQATVSAPTVQRVVDFTTIAERAPNAVDAQISPNANNEHYMVGFGGNILGPHPQQRWKTEVTWGPLSPVPTAALNMRAEGSWMEARKLGPDHPLGSSPSGDTPINSDRLFGFTGVRYIAGHLLNDNLGGTGSDPRNIVAIPETTNHKHLGVEAQIKAAVNQHGQWVYYKVWVAERHADGTAKTLKTQWYLLNTAGNRAGDSHEMTFNIPEVANIAGTATVPGDPGAPFVWERSDTVPGGGAGGIAAASDVAFANPIAQPLTNTPDDYAGRVRPSIFPHNPALEQAALINFLESTNQMSGGELGPRTASQNAFVENQGDLEVLTSARRGDRYVLKKDRKKSVFKDSSKVPVVIEKTRGAFSANVRNRALTAGKSKTALLAQIWTLEEAKKKASLADQVKMDDKIKELRKEADGM